MSDVASVQQGGMMEGRPRLSICIATYNRSKFIGETLDSILPQLSSSVELLVVEGASPDDTHEVMSRYVQRYPQIRYFREQENSGIDRDYDKAVGYAGGEYCWLMTDDDLLRPGAVDRVLAELDGGRDLVIVNAEVRNADFSEVLAVRQLNIAEDRIYDESSSEEFFSKCMNYLSFIGGVVVRRGAWMKRDRAKYYGTLFVHVGVIFQDPPICSVYVISDPLIVIRYGNAMWTARGFEIWSFKWPELVWSFTSFSSSSKHQVCHPAPWKRTKTLLYYRATGAYSADEFKRFIADKTSGIRRLVSQLISCIPAKVAVLVSVLYFSVFNRAAEMMKYDVLRSRHATTMSRWFARLLWK